MIKYSKFPDNIGSGDFTDDTRCQNAGKFQKSGETEGGCYNLHTPGRHTLVYNLKWNSLQLLFYWNKIFAEIKFHLGW